LPAAPDENSKYTVWVPVTFVMFAGTVRQEDQPVDVSAVNGGIGLAAGGSAETRMSLPGQPG
jgi:hypothetical protein